MKPLLKKQLAKRLHLLGHDLTGLHEVSRCKRSCVHIMLTPYYSEQVVPPSVLPPSLGGTNAAEEEPGDWLFGAIRRQEDETGMIGGWALPLMVSASCCFRHACDGSVDSPLHERLHSPLSFSAG